MYYIQRKVQTKTKILIIKLNKKIRIYVHVMRYNEKKRIKIINH